MDDLEVESYISGNLYVSPKFVMNKVSCDFAQKYTKNVDFQKWSGFDEFCRLVLQVSQLIH